MEHVGRLGTKIEIKASHINGLEEFENLKKEIFCFLLLIRTMCLEYSPKIEIDQGKTLRDRPFDRPLPIRMRRNCLQNFNRIFSNVVGVHDISKSYEPIFFKLCTFL